MGSGTGVSCGGCGAPLEADCLTDALVQRAGAGVLIQRIGPVLHQCGDPTLVRNRRPWWIATEEETAVNPTERYIDMGTCPTPQSTWQTFWYHVAMGSLMHYPVWRVVAFAWINRRWP
jgi:hypothetical protein